MKSIIVKYTLIERIIVPDNTIDEKIIEISQKKILNKICWLKKLKYDNVTISNDEYDPSIDKEDK